MEIEILRDDEYSCFVPMRVGGLKLDNKKLQKGDRLYGYLNPDYSSQYITSFTSETLIYHFSPKDYKIITESINVNYDDLPFGIKVIIIEGHGSITSELNQEIKNEDHVRSLETIILNAALKGIDISGGEYLKSIINAVKIVKLENTPRI